MAETHIGRARRLPPELAMLRTSNARHRLPAVFGTVLLIMLALGVMIGAGIFSLAGQQAATMAGPAVIASFLIAAVVCLLAALSYAELSSTLPTAGSVYTFAYVAFGEVWAWIVDWALVLELLVAAALVSRVWAAYLTSTLDGFDVGVPTFVAEHSSVGTGTGWIAAALVIVLALLVMAGTKLSGRVLATIVAVKLTAVVLVIAIGARHVQSDNYTPFVPDVEKGAGARGTVLQSLLGGSGDAFGVMGVFTAAGVIVFAFIGFDLIATAAEDARNPRRTIPRAMLGAVAIVTVLYVAMAAVLVGLRPYDQLGTDAPVSDALRRVGPGWSANVVNVGALLGLTTVVLVVLIAQSRVLFAMGRDGLLPQSLARVGAGSSPSRAALVAGVAAALLALDPGTAKREQLLVLGTLFAFAFCAVGVIRLRRTQPDLERGFRVPLVPLVPVLSLLATVWLSLNLSPTTWRNFGIWMVVGIAFYVAYGRSHSHLVSGESSAVATPETPEPEEPPRPARPPGAHRA
jgi:basic amino acid/polyamine antiporter, APA family